MAENFFKNLTLTKIILTALIIRLLLLPWVYHGDVTVTYWWGKFASEFGWRGYYDWLNFGGYGRPDQPMLNIYYDWSVRQIYLFFYDIFWFLNTHISLFPSKFMQWYFINGNQILLKLPMVFSDIFLIFLSYKFFLKIFNSQKAKIIAIVLTFYLPLIYNSAVWGSGDSIINLFGLLCVYLVWQKKYISSALFFLLSILYKSSLLIWIPIIIVSLIKNNIKRTEICKATIFFLLFISLVSFPFTPLGINPLIWFFQTMLTKILPGAMPQLTANAFNFWALLYGLKPQLDEIILFGGFSARMISIVLCFIGYLIICRKLYLNYNLKNLLLSLVNISLVTFVFMTRMHERYTFPALIPLLILCFYDKKFIKYFVVLTITHLLNVYNWWWVPTIHPLEDFLSNNIVIKTISLTNLCITLLLLFFNFSIPIEADNSPIRSRNGLIKSNNSRIK